MGKIFRSINWTLWGVLFVTLPITSMPLVSRLVGGTMVAPPAMLLLVVLIVIGFIPYLLRGGRLANQNITILVFFSIALTAALASLYLEIPTYKIQPDWKMPLEAVITLALGVAYFLTVQSWFTSENSLRVVFRLVNLSGLVLIVWALIQALYWHIDLHYPSWMRMVQESLSNGTMFARRATGFAFEPSWLAHQLNVFYFPLWIASVFYRRSAFGWRLWVFQMEDALLAGAMVVLVFTSSRIGFLGFIMLVGFLFLMLQGKALRWVKRKLPNPHSWRWVQPLLIGSLVILYIGVLFGAATILQQRDPRMKQMFNLESIRNGEFMTYARNLTFASRVVYWQAGMRIFEDHPFLGVGPGNAGYYFYDKMPNAGWGLVEIRQILIRDQALPNIKNLWVRLLAETGFIGFFSFVVFLVVMVWSGQVLRKHGSGFSQVIGFSAILVCVAMIGEGFSLDTFALPYTWLIFGLCVAATQYTVPAPSLKSGDLADD
jgi:O-antigen ligase